MHRLVFQEQLLVKFVGRRVGLGNGVDLHAGFRRVGEAVKPADAYGGMAVPKEESSTLTFCSSSPRISATI